MARAKTPAQLRKHISFLKRQITTAEKNLKKAKAKKVAKKKPTKKRKTTGKKKATRKRRR